MRYASVGLCVALLLCLVPIACEDSDGAYSYDRVYFHVDDEGHVYMSYAVFAANDASKAAEYLETTDGFLGWSTDEDATEPMDISDIMSWDDDLFPLHLYPVYAAGSGSSSSGEGTSVTEVSYLGYLVFAVVIAAVIVLVAWFIRHR